MSDIYNRLSEPFPQEMEKIINKGGVNLTYIPVSEVINRLNKVFGVDKWSMTIESCHRDPADPDFVLAHVRIDWFTSDFASVSRDGFGGQKIKRTKTGAILDLGDEFKGAISDAVKKVAQAFGVGLYLARSEEAMEIVQLIEASNTPPSEHELKWEDFKSMSKSLTKEQREQLNIAWTGKYGIRPKPQSSSDINPEDLEFLVAQAVAIVTGGQVVESQ